jgi:hypothetical protein
VIANLFNLEKEMRMAHPQTPDTTKPQVNPPPNMPGKEQRQGDYQGKPIPQRSPDQQVPPK